MLSVGLRQTTLCCQEEMTHKTLLHSCALVYPVDPFVDFLRGVLVADTGPWTHQHPRHSLDVATVGLISVSLHTTKAHTHAIEYLPLPSPQMYSLPLSLAARTPYNLFVSFTYRSMPYWIFSGAYREKWFAWPIVDERSARMSRRRGELRQRAHPALVPDHRVPRKATA